METKERIAKAQSAKRSKALRAAKLEADQRAALAAILSGTAWPELPLVPRSDAPSDAERQRAHRAKGRELPPIPRPRHRRVRESCRHDLLRFGLLYCSGEYEGMKRMLKRPPSPRMERFIRALESKILHGGLKHVRWPRGKGKSTWVKIAVIWASLYRHKFFMVVVEKTKGMAQIVVEEIWKRITVSPAISADFPEFSIPMADVALTPQRMRVQTYQGKPTYMRQDVSRFYYYKLPTLEGFPNTGAIIAFRGSEQTLRGINIESARPDFFFIDDPETDVDAANPETVKKIEANIAGAVLGSGELSERISAVMASTPIEPDDVSERFADPSLHPEWETETERLVVKFGPDCEERKNYERMLAIDQHAAHEYYVEHRAAIEDGAEMMDDGDYTPGVEASAYEHALYTLFVMKSAAFSAEMQMTPTRSVGIYRISAQIVRESVNGVPSGVIPAACTTGLLAFCDVNSEAGLRWEIAAFGPGRVVAVLAYGQYPGERQRLIPEGIPTDQIPVYLAPALRAVATSIAAMHFTSEDGTVHRVSGLCIDGNWQTATVANIVDETNERMLADFPLGWCARSRGFASWGQGCYSASHHEIAATRREVADARTGRKFRLTAAEECHLWNTAYGTVLAFNSHYWKEVSQTSFFAGPLAPCSSSLYGGEPFVHADYAQEICSDELTGKETSTKYGVKYTWKESAHGPNHYGDCHAGVMAFGSIRGFYDGIGAVVAASASPSPDQTAKPVKPRRSSKYVYRP